MFLFQYHHFDWMSRSALQFSLIWTALSSLLYIDASELRALHFLHIYHVYPSADTCRHIFATVPFSLQSSIRISALILLSFENTIVKILLDNMVIVIARNIS